MAKFLEWINRLWGTLRRRRADHDLEEELRVHLEFAAEDIRSRGCPPENLKQATGLKVGGISQAMEALRHQRGLPWLEDLARDLHYAARALRHSPGFATLAILIMALGVGANTAVFGVVNAVLLKPLSFHDPDRIVVLSSSFKKGEGPTPLFKQVSIPDFQDWHDQSSSFEAMAYYASRERPVVRNGAAEFTRVTPVSPEFFRVFDVEPIAGHPFTAEEMKTGSGGAAMISYAYWQSHYGGDWRAVGQTIRAPGPRPIAGVMPRGFRFPNNTDVWVSAVGPPGSRGGQNFLAIGRLKTSVSLEQAQAEMTTIATRLEQQYPESNRGRGVAITRIRDDIVGNVRLTLYLLLGAVALVLLIACANTATLLLSKATARTREVAVRAALGASRQRIVRQLLAESLLLAFLAGIAGLLIAYGGSKTLVALAPGDLPRLDEISIDGWVLTFTLGISIITSLLFGVVPALYASKINLSDALIQGATRIVSGRGMVRVRGALVIIEIALAAMLVCSAGLLIKSFVALQNVALGFRPKNVLVMRASVPAPIPFGVPPTRQFFKDMLSRVTSLPGVLAAGATMAPPGNADSTGAYLIGSIPANPDWARAPNAVQSIVASGTFAALGIPLKSGRDFTDSDTMDRPLVAVVNEALVRQSFVNQDPIDQTIHCPFDSSNGMTIIGVVGDVRQRGLQYEPMPECYMPYTQHQFNEATLSMVVRTSGDPHKLAETLRRLAHERSPDVSMKFTTMEAMLSDNVAAPRFRTLLLSVFAGLAAFLAMAGVYGVMAYAVGQRSKEIGVRMALGASSRSVLRLVLGQGLVLAAIGLAVGLAAAVATGRLLTSVLFQVRPEDPTVYLTVMALLGAAAMLASYFPASRASRIDPLATLRQE